VLQVGIKRQIRYTSIDKVQGMTNEQSMNDAAVEDPDTRSIRDGSHIVRYLETAIRKAGAGEGNSVFIMAGVNGMAKINDIFGYDIGNETIGAVGRCLRGCLRKADYIDHYSFNKFAILLRNTKPNTMEAVAQRFLRVVRSNIFQAAYGKMSASISLGGVMITDCSQDARKIISNSLEALAQAKQSPNHFSVYEPSPERDMRRRRNLQIADEIINALNEQRMLLALQPIVDSRTLQPSWYEALIRMRRTNGEIVTAGEFIPVAEQLGIASLIDYRMLEMSIALAKSRPELNMSLNISGTTANDYEWLACMENLVGGDETLARRLVVEITETVAVQNLAQSTDFIRRVQKLGCRVAIDDFGAGYTSFKYLREFGVDIVKIDGCFIRNLRSSSDDRLFVSMLIELAQKLGIETVAEYVEHEETASYLQKINTTYMQGYLFGKPEFIENGNGETREEDRLIA
jgi:diguanylate cyclase (GGDEF)-like protein